jgi:uncharacterized protein YfiM (DUF2279 family)
VIATAGLALALLVAQQKPAAQGSPPRDSWFGADKLKHFFVAAFTQSVTYSALQTARVRHDHALAGAWAVTAAVSVAKEVHDKRTTGLFSVRDLVWDAAGAGFATVLLARSRRSESKDEAPADQAVLQSLPSAPALLIRSRTPLRPSHLDPTPFQRMASGVNDP